MSFIVSEKAIHSFKNDWDLEEGQYIRIYAKYAGGGSEAFSIGINSSAIPIDPALVKSIGGFYFFIEKTDSWILKDEFLKIDSNEEGIFLNKISC